MRNCIDNAYILTSIVRQRRRQKLSTFVCYVDFSRAIDNINHVLLIRKFLDMNINGAFCRVIRSVSASMYGAGEVGGYMTT